MGLQVHIPAKLLMLATSLVSILVSFAGGLVMYLEGLQIVENTVREISQVEVSSTAEKLNSSIGDSYEASLAYLKLLTSWRGISTLEQWREFLHADQFGRVKASAGLYGIGVFSVPLVNTARNRSGFCQMLWWDPLADGSRDYVSGYYAPQNWGVCVEPPRNDTLKHRCMVSNSIDPENGTFVSHVYDTSDNNFNGLGPGGRWERQQRGWEERGAVWWRAPDVWKSKDDTPYSYGILVRTAPVQPPDHPVWGRGFKLVIMTYNIFNSWEDDLRAVGVAATLVATFLDAGLDSQAIATNTGERLLQPDCVLREVASGRNPCFVTLRKLRPDIQEACLKTNQTAEGRFFRTSIGGSEHWVMRLVVQRTREGYDEMSSIHLVWLRRVSTVEGELNRALYFFIGFVAAVFVFDLCILIAEVRHLARPLEYLEWAMAPVDRMDLEEGSLRLQGAGRDHCFNVLEVERLVWRFKLTLRALTTYKAFLPQSCLHRDEPSEAEEAAAAEEGETSKETPRRVSARHQSVGSSRAPTGTHTPDVAGSEPPSPRGLERPRSLADPGQLRLRAWFKGSAWKRGSSRGSSFARKMTSMDFGMLRQSQEIVGAQRSDPKRKLVTLLAVNRHGLLASQVMADPHTAAESIGAAVSAFAAAVGQCKGNVDLLSGDHHFASFDAAHRCPGHRMAALSCAWVLRAERGEHLSSAAVCCGEVLRGDFGGTSLMRFMVIGGLPCALLAAERIATRRGIEVLMDSKVQQDAVVTWSVQLIDRVLHAKHLAAPFCLWRAVAPHESKEGEEWMYDLASQTNPYEDYNQILANILKGQLKAARAALAKHLPSVPAAAKEAVEEGATPGPSPDASPNGQPASSVTAAIQELQRRLQTAEADGDGEGVPVHFLIEEYTLALVREV